MAWAVEGLSRLYCVSASHWEALLIPNCLTDGPRQVCLVQVHFEAIGLSGLSKRPSM